MKIIKYLIAELLFIILIINNYGMFVNMDKADLVCINEGINNYLQFDWNSYFHWFRDDINTVCRFDTQSLFMYFWFVLTYYTLFKIITLKIFPDSLKLKILIPETLVYILSFGIRIVWADGFEVTSGSLQNAAFGLLYMFSPFIAYVIIVYLAYHMAETYGRKMPQSVKNLFLSIGLFIFSVVAFPPVWTILYSLLLLPFILWFIYLYIPRLFVKSVADKQTTPTPHFGLKLPTGIILFLGCVSYEILFSRQYYRALSIEEFFAYYVLFTTFIRLTYYLLIALIWNPKAVKNFVNKLHLIQNT